MSPTMTLVALVGAHSFLDFAGQGDFMSKAKNHKAPIPGVPSTTVMNMHALQHAAAVALITGIWWLGILEFGIHWITDWRKCEGQISFVADQQVHLTTKILFALVVFTWPGLSEWSVR